MAIPLALLATWPQVFSTAGDRPSLLRRTLYLAARMVLNLMRSVPEIMWALLFVRAIGLGPAPGVLAIAVGYAGVMGKVFSEIFESTPREPAQALASAGAPPVRVFAFGIAPQAMPLITSYTLYRFDC